MIEKRRGASPQSTCRGKGNPGPEKPKTVTSKSVTWRCLNEVGPKPSRFAPPSPGPRGPLFRLFSEFSREKAFDPCRWPTISQIYPHLALLNTQDPVLEIWKIRFWDSIGDLGGTFFWRKIIRRVGGVTAKKNPSARCTHT